MNKTKTIYFLSALVLIIGCYALNLSYSLFVDTKENEFLSTEVPYLAANLTESTFTIPANSSKLVKLQINNVGTANMNYGVSIPTLPSGITVQLVDKDGNNITDTLVSNTSKELLVYVTNTNLIDTDVTFNLISKYTTLTFDMETFKTTSNIDYTNMVSLLNEAILADTRITKNTTVPIFTNTADYVITGDSTSGEPGMYSAEDDYGESWYFRGAQSYNYVNFAGFTWRIVRINGDGSIRLILDGTLDKVSECTDETICTTSSFNDIVNDNGHLGYMFGEFDSASINYDEAHSNVNDSTIKTKIDAFYERYIKDRENYLADTLFCGDKTVSYSEEYNGWSDEEDSLSSNNKKDIEVLLLSYNSEYESFAYAKNTVIYSTHQRLNDNSPSLKCADGASNNYSRYTSTIDDLNSTILGVDVNNALSYPIALLSADELVMAGAEFSIYNTTNNNSSYTINTSNYLNDSGKSIEYWWTMSLSMFGDAWGGIAGINVYSGRYDLVSDANYTGLVSSEYDMGVRPVINLRSDSVLVSGDGTSTYTYDENGNVLTGPYIIE